MTSLCEFHEGNYDAALAHFIEARDIKTRLLGESHMDVIYTLDHIAQVYQKQRKYELAQSLYLLCRSKIEIVIDNTDIKQ